jgi:hypothetical protein
MKVFSLAFVCLLSVGLLNAQVESREKTVRCADILKQITAEWKVDSLGLKGYRFDYFYVLIQSKPDSLSKNELLKHLGPPNRIQKTAYGRPWRDHVEYIYFIFHEDPKGKILPFAGAYLSFVFDEGERFLEEIKDGIFCG